MKKPELLSPAGNMECLKAAIAGGCDAIYIGGYTFGARNYAGNFSDKEIVEAVSYAHLYGVKIYVTVNTIIYDDEVEMFINYVDFLHKNNVDAIIMQDLGMMDLVRKTYPNLEIHASTQMHIHNVDGLKFAKEVGIKRVVVARETSYELLKEMKNIDIELETFIHGALCMSYSGQCLMSCFTTNRSGNRGTCSQPCRLKYSLYNSDNLLKDEAYLLSTKDLNTINYIGSLIDIGIDSLKIEGRMKRPEYVYLITKLYRKAIDNYIANKTVDIKENDIREMKKLFNREFTKGFLFNEKNNDFVNEYRPNHLGVEIGTVISKNNNRVKIRLKDYINQGDGIRIIAREDIGFTANKIYVNGLLVSSAKKDETIELETNEYIEKGSKVLKTTDIFQIKQIQEEIRNNNRKIKIKGKIECKINRPLKLELTDGVNNIVVIGNEVIEALKTPISKDQIFNQIKKLGDTVYELENLIISNDSNIFIRINDLNELRRNSILELNKKRLYSTNYKKENYEIQLKEYVEEQGDSILIRNVKQYQEIKNKEFKYIYVTDIKLLDLKDNRIIYKTPRALEKSLKLSDTLNGEIGSLYLNRGIADFSLNVVNSYTVAFLHSIGIKRVTLSYELTENQIIKLFENYVDRYHIKPNLELIVKSNPELMVLKYNLFNDFKLDNGYLKDIKNNKFYCKNRDGATYIYHYKKINILKKSYLGIINTFRIELLDYEDIITL